MRHSFAFIAILATLIVLNGRGATAQGLPSDPSGGGAMALAPPSDDSTNPLVDFRLIRPRQILSDYFSVLQRLLPERGLARVATSRFRTATTPTQAQTSQLDAIRRRLW